jgi:hypothetical protein
MATAFHLWEAQMSWISIGDILWFAGALFAAGFVVYGWWMCMIEPEANPHRVPGDARSRGATPEAKPLARRRYDAARRYEAARRGAHAASRRMAI